MKKLALVHTVPFLVGVFKGLLEKSYPELDNFHMLDESLLQDARRDGGMTPAIIRRMTGLCALAQDAGAKAILFTCSATSPGIDAVRPLMDVPVMKIDDAMAARAVRSGTRIGLLCTNHATAGPSADIIFQHAAKAEDEVNIDTVVENDAFTALSHGNQQGHDEALIKAAEGLAGHCDVIVLAQASMAHLAGGLSESLKIPVLESPSLCVEALATTLAD
jgi:Asp/Glu/hydantoin racemase